MPQDGLKNVYGNNRKRLFDDGDLRIWSVPSGQPGVGIIQVEKRKARTKATWEPVWKGSVSHDTNAIIVKTMPRK